MKTRNAWVKSSAALVLLAAAGLANAERTVRVDMDQLLDTARAPAALRDMSGMTIELGRRGTTLLPQRVETHKAAGVETVAGRTAAGGHFLLSRADDDVRGVLWTALGTFELTGIENARGVTELTVRPIPGDLPDCGGAIEALAPAPAPPGGPRSDTTSRVLVVFSQQAADRIGNTDVFAANAIASTNTAYINSDINPLRVELAGAVVLGDPPSLSSGVQLGAITNLHDGYADEIAGLRDALAADMVAWIGDMTGVCGRAYLAPNNPDRMFSVTDPDCAIGNLTFAHELGHNYGASHDPDNAGTPVLPDAFGHRWSNDSFRSVMAFAPGSRVPQFSNPDVSFGGSPTGILNQRDNGRLHEVTGPIVANHRVGPGTATADCNGNGRLDALEIAENATLDGDRDGTLDACQIAANPALDCDDNGVLDSVQLDPTRTFRSGTLLNVAPGAPQFIDVPVGTDLVSDIEFTVGGTGDFGESFEFVELVVGATNPVTLTVPFNLAGDCEATGITTGPITVSAAQIAADLPNVPVEVRVSTEVGTFCSYNALQVTASWTGAAGTLPCPSNCAVDFTGPALDGNPDGTVDASDLTLFLNEYTAQFGTPGGTGPNGFNADLTGPAQDGNPDGTVDASDLTLFLDTYVAEFGPCTGG